MFNIEVRTMGKYFVSIVKVNKTKKTTVITGDFFDSKEEAFQNVADFDNELYKKCKLLGCPYTENYGFQFEGDFVLSVDVLDVDTIDPENSDELTYTMYATPCGDN